jgi:hypothetical protein
MRCENCGKTVMDLDMDNPLAKDLVVCAVDGHHVYRVKDGVAGLVCDDSPKPVEFAWNRTITPSEVALLATEDCGGLLLPPR